MQPSPLTPSILAVEPYAFAYQELDNSTFTVMIDGTWSLYCYEGSLFVDGIAVGEGDIAHHSGILGVTGTGKFFVLANPGVHPALDYLQVMPGQNSYTVSKPWGKEVWLTGRARKDYCMKRIHIKAGHQTSLQYHERKVETNVLMEGEIELVGENGYCEKLVAPAYVNITPPTVHRVRALTDIVLVEASTADLDDVVRLEDDTNRQNGRIEDEHKQ
jgi:mannose-6-phosphate isomerase